MRAVAEEMKRLVGKALHSRAMIQDGDHVMAAVSGGKDSLAMVWLLRDRIRRVPISYRVSAVHIDPGFGADSAGQMEAFFSSHGFEYRIVRSDFGPLAHCSENRENACFICSRRRRNTLFRLAKEMGCNKIAFGHHKDDVIETFFLNLLYGASISTMTPVQEFFKGRLHIIRPLFMIEEDLIRRYAHSMGWPEIRLGCPSVSVSKREEVRVLLDRLYGSSEKIKGNIFHALHNVRQEYLL